MANEILPRWNLANVDFITTDSEQIKSEILTKYEEVSGRTLSTADPIRLFLLSIADVIIQQRSAINIAAQQNLLSYATGTNLDALGLYLSVDRLAESYAVTTLRFTLAQALGNDYVIPINTEVTNGIVTFATNAELVITAGTLTGDVAATCTQAGVIGNDYLAGQINTIVQPRAFLSGAQNTTTTAGGADAESDAEYADRIRLAPNSFSVAGPEKAYEFYTYSVSSAIVDVSVVSPTPGAVKIYPLLEGGELPSADVLDQVEAYLSSEYIRPLTDEVEALSPIAENYAITVDYWINREDVNRATQINEAVTEAVENYRLWQQAKIGRDITPDQLICNVMGAGAARIDFATLSPANWVQLASNEVAQCSGVTITYKGVKDE